jgi:hypothetical protein
MRMIGSAQPDGSGTRRSGFALSVVIRRVASGWRGYPIVSVKATPRLLRQPRLMGKP